MHFFVIFLKKAHFSIEIGRPAPTFEVAIPHFLR